MPSPDPVREETGGGELLQLGEYGPVFELRSPHTVASIKADAAAAAISRRPIQCRLRHAREVVGTPAVTGDLIEDALNMIAGRDTRNLVRCRRCRKVSVQRVA